MFSDNHKLIKSIDRKNTELSKLEKRKDTPKIEYGILKGCYCGNRSLSRAEHKILLAFFNSGSREDWALACRIPVLGALTLDDIWMFCARPVDALKSGGNVDDPNSWLRTPDTQGLLSAHHSKISDTEKKLDDDIDMLKSRLNELMEELIAIESDAGLSVVSQNI